MRSLVGEQGAASRPSLWAALRLDHGAMGLLFLWAAIVCFVDPRGEFPINDDWSFRRALERLLNEGRLGTTGWGPDEARSGGPSLITHLLWASLFVHSFGFSWWALRAAVLVAAVLGTLAIYASLRNAGLGLRFCVAATASVVFGPLFLSQSFTFMSDVTLASVLAMALFALVQAADQNSTRLLVVGQLLSLAAILTRQLGLALPLALLMLCPFHPGLRKLGLKKVALSTLALVIVPWILFEVGLAYFGSTPVTQHAVTHKLLTRLQTGALSALLLTLWKVIHHELLYLGLLLSPITWLSARALWAKTSFRRLSLGLGALFVCAELGVWLGWLRIPVLLNRNVITPWGLGPVLLKDIYVLRMSRFDEIPQPLWCLCVFLALWSAIILVWQAVRLGSAILRANTQVPLVSALSFLSALLYLGVIGLSGFHDRYLITPCLLLTVALLTYAPPDLREVGRLSRTASGLCFGGLVAFAVLGTRDFMEIKRAQAAVLAHTQGALHTSACDMDAGFEHNGYHCYRTNAFAVKPQLSPWWVERERYIVALGELPGYKAVHRVPFTRWLGTDGAVMVLEPAALEARGARMK